VDNHTYKPQDTLHKDHEKLSAPEDVGPGGLDLSNGIFVKDEKKLTDPREGTGEDSAPKTSSCPVNVQHSTDPPHNHFHDKQDDVDNPRTEVSSWQPRSENS